MDPIRIASAAAAAPRPTSDSMAVGPGGFESALRRAMNEVRWSDHASSRLAETPGLTGDQRQRLADAVSQAADRGCRQSMMLLDDMALIVSVSNRTVITAVPADRIRHNVFTNIDSAVLIPKGAGPQ